MGSYPSADDIGPGSSQNDWQMASFQIKSQDQVSFLKHVYEAVEIAKKDPKATLVISGGYTKEGIQTSESASYLRVAKDRGLLTDEEAAGKVLLEEYARDSYENVLFSLMLYRQRVGKWPDFFKIVGYEFKRHRMVVEHLRVFEIPPNRVEYIGIGPFYPPKEYFGETDTKNYEADKKQFFSDLYEAERTNALEPFWDNPFGSMGSKAHAKKEQRDPFDRAGSEVYYVPGEDAMNTMLAIDSLEFSQALELYKEDCVGQFAWPWVI